MLIKQEINSLKKNNVLVNMLAVFFLLIIMYFSNSAPSIFIFWSSVVLVLLIIFISKFSILSIISVAILYPLISAYYQLMYERSYGILQLEINSRSMNLYFGIISKTCFFVLLEILFFCLFTNFLSIEKKQFSRNIVIKTQTANILSFISVLTSIIAFPQLSIGFSSQTRFDSLLPGNAWNHVALVTLVISCLSHFKDSRIVKYNSLFVIFWFLIHYERVDMFGFFIGMLILFNVKSKTKLSLFKKIAVAFIFIIVFFLFIYIGEVRNGISDVSFTYILHKILIQNTATDVLYTYNCSIDYVEKFGFLHGISYSSYLYHLIPFADSQDFIPSLLSINYPYPGGIFILSEPFMNFGVSGVIAIFFTLLMIIYCFAKTMSIYSYYAYVFLTVIIIRIMWYGIDFGFVSFIYILPIILIFIGILEGKIKVVFSYRQ